jgi:uncharacterized membrane protein YfcA
MPANPGEALQTMMPLSLPQVTATAVLILLAALIKTGFGVGAGIFLSATLCLVLPPKTAIAIGGPVMLLTDILPVWQFRKEICRPVLAVLMLGSLGGILAGGLIINSIPDRWFIRTVGILCSLFTVQQLFKHYRPPGFQGGMPAIMVLPLPRWVGFVIGLLGGIASAISHAGGVIYSIYMMRLGMTKGAFVGTLVAVFFLSDILKIGVYWNMNFLSPQMVVFVAWMIPLVILGGFLGYLIHQRISTVRFEKIILVIVLLISLRLIF